MEKFSKFLTYFILVLGFASMIFLLTQPPYYRSFLTNEGSLIEDLSLVFYSIGILTCFIYFCIVSGARIFWLEMTFLLSFFLMREMDFQVRFTDGMSVMQGRFYFNPDFPPFERLGYALYFVFLFCIIFHIAGYAFPFYWHSLKEKRAWAITATAYLFSFFSAYLIERMLKDIMVFFISMERAEVIEPVFEEILELMAAIFLFLSVIQLKCPLKDWIQSIQKTVHD